MFPLSLVTSRSCLPFRNRLCYFRCWRKVSDQREKSLKEEKAFVKLYSSSWSCCPATVTEPTAILGMEPLDEAKFSDPLATKLHSRFGYSLSEVWFCGPQKICKKEYQFLFIFSSSQSHLPSSILSSLPTWQHRSSNLNVAAQYQGNTGGRNQMQIELIFIHKQWLSVSYVPGT